MIDFINLKNYFQPDSGSKEKKSNASKEEKHIFVHLSILRDYLDLEFQELKECLPFEYDLEHLIDDWVCVTIDKGENGKSLSFKFLNFFCFKN